MARLARFRSITVNNCPVWECSGCGERRVPSTRQEHLAAHEAICGQPITRKES